MRLSCTIFGIRQVICRNSPTSAYPTCIWRPPLRVTQFEFRKDFWHQKTRVPEQSCGVICTILHLILSVEHRLVTDGQTHRHTHGHGIYRAEYSSCGNKNANSYLHSCCTNRRCCENCDTLQSTCSVNYSTSNDQHASIMQQAGYCDCLQAILLTWHDGNAVCPLPPSSEASGNLFVFAILITYFFCMQLETLGNPIRLFNVSALRVE